MLLYLTDAAMIESDLFFFLVDAEIVSIDAFNKSAPKRGLVVGITFVKVIIPSVDDVFAMLQRCC